MTLQAVAPATEIVLDWHAKQAVAPVVADQALAGQGAHEEDEGIPEPEEKVPAMQKTHAKDEMIPDLVEYVPA